MASRDELLTAHGRDGDPAAWAAMARELLQSGERGLAASAFDRAFGLDPTDAELAAERTALLDELSVTELGLRFRYIPAGTFIMGSAAGDPDESPPHPVRLHEYWMSETPISWAKYCELLDWMPPPEGRPRDLPKEGLDAGHRHKAFSLFQANKIRLQYCENETLRSFDWHAHVPPDPDNPEQAKQAASIFGTPQRLTPERPFAYDEKSIVAISWQDAEILCEAISDDRSTYRLPTEAQWEKAARGGLIDRRYSWGDEDPSADRCDYENWSQFAIAPSRSRPPNGYGLHAMCGGVWEWTSDWYDAERYSGDGAENPTGPESGTEKALRGGSWADCAEAVTVTFRTSRPSSSWRTSENVAWGGCFCPNIGFRLCRTERVG